MPLTSTSNDNVTGLKAKFVDISEDFIRRPINQACCLTREHLDSLQRLKEEDVFVTQPDKSAGFVVIDKDEYRRKMHDILNDDTKFRKPRKQASLIEVEHRVNNELQVLLI